jgi:dCMP deaminase
MSKEYKKHMTFLRIAKEFANLSHCVSHKVAAIAVKDGRIVCSGINGTPPGDANCDDIFDADNFDREEHKLFSDKKELHAEMNLILSAAREGISLKGSTLYCTLFPCGQCIKNLMLSGISTIYYAKVYDRYSEKEYNDTLLWCRNRGITIEHIQV